MLLQSWAFGVTMSWDEGFPGARASRPHQAWHSLGHLPHLDQPGTAPWLSFGLADGVLAHRVAACSIALMLSGGQRDSMRAGRPRSQAMPSRPCRGGCLAGDFSESRRAPFGVGSRGRCGITGITLLNFRVLPDKTRTRDVPPNPSGGSRTPHASCHGGSAFPISTRNCRMRGQVIPLIQQRPQGLTTSPKTTGLPEPQAGTSTRCSRT